MEIVHIGCYVYAPMTILKITMAQSYTTPDYVEEIGSSPVVATKI